MAAVHYHEGRFPPEERLDWPALIPLIGPAVAAVARYDGALAAIPNPRILLSPMTTREAVLSSRIEGTQATMGEVLEFEAGKEAESPERRADIHEVLNYRAAMREAERMLEELPICQRVVREAHRVLLSGVRGEGKSPGDYRRVPNWIGPPGYTVEEATFVPVGADSSRACIAQPARPYSVLPEADGCSWRTMPPSWGGTTRSVTTRCRRQTNARSKKHISHPSLL